MRHIEGMGDVGDAGSAGAGCGVSAARSTSSFRRVLLRLRVVAYDGAGGAVPRRWCSVRRGQLVGENAPMGSSVGVSTGATGAARGSMPRGRVRKGCAALARSEVEAARSRAAGDGRRARAPSAEAEAERERAWVRRRIWTGSGWGSSS